MYVVTVTFDIDPAQWEVFLPLMVENARVSRESEPGCQLFDICCDAPSVFLYEVYDTRAAFEAHLKSAHFKAFDAAVAKMVTGKTVKTFGEVIR